MNLVMAKGIIKNIVLQMTFLVTNFDILSKNQKFLKIWPSLGPYDARFLKLYCK